MVDYGDGSMEITKIQELILILLSHLILVAFYLIFDTLSDLRLSLAIPSTKFSCSFSVKMVAKLSKVVR